MAIDYKSLAAKWRRAFWAVVDDSESAKEILAAKKARRKAKAKKRVTVPKNGKPRRNAKKRLNLICLTSFKGG